MPHRYAFTLIELLVVMAIIALVFGMGLAVTTADRSAAQVQAAAEELAATLRQARMLAITRNTMYGVAFNIQNAPGSTGAVLNNRSGGHYYRIIGPKGPDGTSGAPSGYNLSTAMLPGSIPQAKAGVYENWGKYQDGIAAAWVGEPRHLPKGRVRFLALSDTDEGPIRRRESTALGTTNTAWYGTGGETSYPRPYFGVFDQNSKTWYAWGGYKASAVGTTSMGLWYQSGGSAITGCQDATGNPIPLVSADTLDACIVFLPSGRACYLEFKQGRRAYNNPAGTTLYPGHKPVIVGYDGTVTDMGGNPSTFSIAGYNSHIDIPEIAHFDRHTGGFHITLAGDAETDKTTFPDARTALRAIGPMQRVFIGSNGSVRCQHVQVRDVYQPPTAWWPASPADWLDTANTTSNKVFANCRLGWLHVVNATDNGLTPRGRPVCYIVAPSMLVNRTWWCE